MVMKQHISDKAEVSVDFPDKAYYGTFGQHSTFEVRTDERGIHIDLQRDSGEKRHVGFHIHYYLLADLLTSIGRSLAKERGLDQIQRETLTEAAQVLCQALEGNPKGTRKAKSKR